MGGAELPLSDALACDDGTAHAIVSAAQTLSNNFRNGQLESPEDLVAFALGYAERSGAMPKRAPGAVSPSKIARRALREDRRASLDKVGTSPPPTTITTATILVLCCAVVWCGVLCLSLIHI